MRSHLLNFWSGLCKRFSKHVLLLCSWLRPRGRHKCLLLKKTPCTSDTRPRAEADLKATSLGIAFITPEGARQAPKGGKQTTILPNYDAYEAQKQPVWHHNPKGRVAMYMSWW